MKNNIGPIGRMCHSRVLDCMNLTTSATSSQKGEENRLEGKKLQRDLRERLKRFFNQGIQHKGQIPCREWL